MKAATLAILTIVLCMLGHGTAQAQQILAFPGAEGAGRYAVGGRGGDVYHVTNLNDSGPGSLRAGISSASGPRTIIFNVGGNIHLQTDLYVNRPYLTIAGQTAPGGGITLADRMVRIQDAHNVILQHVRMRPGRTYTGTGYEPDALWVQRVDNVMVDHVTASWATDENLSVTRTDTHNVTVQWSMIVNALHLADHEKGNHGYGSIMAGSPITFHHNLYAHNRSRNPRAGDINSRLEFSRNVIYNPGGRYGYNGGESMHVNFIGNIGIDGPRTTSGSLFHSGSTATHIYADDNYLDRNRTLPFHLTPAGTRTLSGNYTTADQPFGDGLQPLPPATGRQTYIHVLSRAGASLRRDSLDRDVIGTVLDKSGTHIDHEDEVGGLVELAAGTPPVDSSGDGMPDCWKIQMGLNPLQQHHQACADDGYTWLEKYLHYLSAAGFPPEDAHTIVITTAQGRGADAQVSEHDGVSGGNGTAQAINARWSGPTGTRNEYILLRFDLADLVKSGSIADAVLELTAWRSMGVNQLRAYGLLPQSPGQDWDEATIEFGKAPALEFDGNNGTRGLLRDRVVLLGDFSTANETAGQIVTFDNPNLAVFLNLVGQGEGQDNSLATIIIERINQSTAQTCFASRESTHVDGGTEGDYPIGTFAPRLVLEGLAPKLIVPTPDRPEPASDDREPFGDYDNEQPL